MLPNPSYSVRLVSLIVSIFLVVLIMAGVSLSVIESRLRIEAGQKLSLAASTIAHEIAQFLDERYQSLHVVTQLPVLQDSFSEKRQAFFLRLQNEAPQFQRVMLMEPGGTVVASTDPSTIGTVREAVRNAWLAGGPHVVLVQDVTKGEEPEALALKIFLPASSPQAAGQGHVLIAEMQLSLLKPFFSQVQSHLQTEREDAIHLEWQLLEQDGQVLIDSLLREAGQVSLTDLKLPSASLVFQGAPGFVEEVHRRRGVPVLTGYAQVPPNAMNHQWGVLVRMDQSEVVPPIYQALVAIGGVLSLMLVPLFGLLVWLTRRLNREHVQLVEAEMQYRHIFERSLEGIYRSTVAGSLILVNPAMAKMFGYGDPDEMITAFQQSTQSLFVDPDRRMTFLGQVLKGGEVHGFESEIQTKQGERRWIAEAAYLVSNSTGSPEFIEGTVEDISERRRAEEALQQAQAQLFQQQKEETTRVTQELDKVRQSLIRQTKLAALGQLSASIAHELRNPLGAIRNAVFLLKRKLQAGDGKIQQYLTMAEEEIERSDSIIQDLLGMARGKHPIKGVVSLEELVRDGWAKVDTGGQWTLNLDFHPHPFCLWGDGSQLRQVFRNLLENSLQAMAPGPGKVTVTARQEAGMDTVTIHDTGSGIAPEDCERIFDPLISLKPHGHGLGLTICRQIVEGHGGTIEVVEANQLGMTISLRLPQKPFQSDA